MARPEAVRVAVRGGGVVEARSEGGGRTASIPLRIVAGLHSPVPRV